MKHKDGSIVVRLHVVGWAMFVPSWMSHTADKPNAVLADLIQLDRGEPYVMFCLVGLILLAISFVNRLKNRSVLFIKGEDGTGTGEINKEALSQGRLSAPGQGVHRAKATHRRACANIHQTAYPASQDP